MYMYVPEYRRRTSIIGRNSSSSRHRCYRVRRITLFYLSIYLGSCHAMPCHAFCPASPRDNAMPRTPATKEEASALCTGRSPPGSDTQTRRDETRRHVVNKPSRPRPDCATYCIIFFFFVFVSFFLFVFVFLLMSVVITR
ncbi:hypothetical protein IWX49DRAFT_103473 [Phyllosticta citricarpa]|uniref:Uncharacterized protein n=1 Tax=Phyllosticta citricarpa TaxID=55181 RepID=A0ABR1MN05_9PEZI